MKKKSTSRSGVFRLRVSDSLVVALAGVFLVLLGVSAFSNSFTQAQGDKARPQLTAEDFWASTDGPPGGDGLALVTNANGYTFVGTQGAGFFAAPITARRGRR